MAGPTQRPFVTAFACAAVVFVVTVVAMLIAWGSPGSNGANLVGQLFALTVIPAIIIGIIARRAKTAWPTMKIAVAYVMLVAVLLVVLLAGKTKPH
jgi:hypothetical protein